MKKIVIILIISISIFSCRSGKNAKIEATPQKPNILFVLVDDLGIKDLGCTGSSYYETPNIDRLAAKGFIFTQGYATSAVCSPSRASIMTGKFTARHGVTDWIGESSGLEWRKMNRVDKLLPADYVHNLPKNEITLAETLKSNGYKTFFAGKWHLGAEGYYPEDNGFEINMGGLDAGSPKGGYFSPFENPKLVDIQDGENLEIRLANETLAFMKQNKAAPFFAFLSFYAVHGPIQTTQEKWEKYRNKATKQGIHDNGFAMESKLPIRQNQDNPVYGGLVESMDDAVGIVLKGLKELGLEDNTIVVFTSDNGGVSSGDSFSTSNLPYRGGKGYQWEGGIREPFLVYVPWKKSNGKKNEYPVTGADFYPTILDYANIPLLPEQHKDGISLKSIINDGIIPAERPLYWHYPHYGNQGGDPNSIIREGKWKLIHYYEDNRDELYDLDKDVYEHNNVAAQNSETAIKLSNQLKNWLENVHAVYPEEDALFDVAKRKEYDANTISKVLPKLENEREKMLSKDFQPNADWWGSKVTKD